MVERLRLNEQEKIAYKEILELRRTTPQNADGRALHLLLKSLSREQRREFLVGDNHILNPVFPTTKEHGFHILSPNGDEFYCGIPDVAGYPTIHLVHCKVNIIASFCVMPTHAVSSFDIMLMHKLYMEIPMGANYFWYKANVSICYACQACGFYMDRYEIHLRNQQYLEITRRRPDLGFAPKGDYA